MGDVAPLVARTSKEAARFPPLIIVLKFDNTPREIHLCRRFSPLSYLYIYLNCHECAWWRTSRFLALYGQTARLRYRALGLSRHQHQSQNQFWHQAFVPRLHRASGQVCHSQNPRASYKSLLLPSFHAQQAIDYGTTSFTLCNAGVIPDRLNQQGPTWSAEQIQRRLARRIWVSPSSPM